MYEEGNEVEGSGEGEADGREGEGKLNRGRYYTEGEEEGREKGRKGGGEGGE